MLHTQGYPSWVIFKYGDQFFRGCYLRDARRAQANLSQVRVKQNCGKFGEKSFYMFWFLKRVTQ